MPHPKCEMASAQASLQAPGKQAGAFRVRDVAAGTRLVPAEGEALGLRLEVQGRDAHGSTFLDVSLTDMTGQDRAVTLVYAVPLALPAGSRWLVDARRQEVMVAGHEYLNASEFPAIGAGRLSRYPFAAVTPAGAAEGVAVGIDLAWPAFFRTGCDAGTGELFVAFDLGLSREKPSARLRLCQFTFEATWGFRGALARYYDLFPEHFVCRTPRRGLWMPFNKISEVRGWEDFGFAFKEGDNETAWDDQHGILTFHYTEPQTWWMAMAKELPRTREAAWAEAVRQAGEGKAQAKALLVSGYEDESGQAAAKLLSTPWCDGAVWSMNSMPGIKGEFTDFRNKWNGSLREARYSPENVGQLDGEYIDSTEGYVTEELDFRRDHFAAAETPLTFSAATKRPAIFRGLVVFEYMRAIASDLHRMGRLMMGNATPERLCWLAPLADVLGTETDWNPQGQWTPMSDDEFLYRRTLCRGKPFCFLMNTPFDKLTQEQIEKYMQRSLAYGFSPGFFSADAASRTYFSQPELYERDRPLFRRYMPLCRLLAEAGWEPITGARSSDERVYLERFGRRYLTVLNDGNEPRTVPITLDGGASPTTSRELVNGTTIQWQRGETTVKLGAEAVAVIELA